MKILTINSGSSSLKFAVLEINPNGVDIHSMHPLANGAFDSIGKKANYRLIINEKAEVGENGYITDHGQAVRQVLSWLAAKKCDFDAVGHRIVHGGDRLTRPAIIDQAVISEIEAVSELAPLHNPIGLAGIHTCREMLKTGIPMVAVFDTAFHRTLPPYASTYAIPYDLAARHKVRRYGFHGIAHSYLADRYSQITETPMKETRLITLHLGHGCSAAAILGGLCVDTSMGFTPLEGLVMGTRSGDVDPAVVAYLAEREGTEVSTVVQWLNQRSGLLGLSGTTASMRELLDLEGQDDRARLAIDVYCYRVRKYIGAYMVSLSGADAIIFSGGVGENSNVIRQRICRDMQWCGLILDAQRNQAANGREVRISPDKAVCHAYVIPVDEESAIARETYMYLQQTGGPS